MHAKPINTALTPKNAGKERSEWKAAAIMPHNQTKGGAESGRGKHQLTRNSDSAIHSQIRLSVWYRVSFIVTSNTAPLPKLLQIIRQLVRRLIQLDIIRAGHHQQNHTPINMFLDKAAKLRPFRAQLSHRSIEVITHQRDRMMPREIVSLALPFAMGRMHAHLTRSRFENEPVLIKNLGHVFPPEDVPQKRPR